MHQRISPTIKPLFQPSSKLRADWEISPRAFAVPVRRATGLLPPYHSAQGRLPQLKLRLLRELLEAGATPDSARSLRQAANHAEALAWETPYPLLVFPCLFDEKVRQLQPHNSVDFLLF